MVTANLVLICIIVLIAAGVAFVIWKFGDSIVEGITNVAETADQFALRELIFDDNKYAMSESTRNQQNTVTTLADDLDTARYLESNNFWTRNPIENWEYLKLFCKGGSAKLEKKLDLAVDEYTSLKSTDEVFIESVKASGDDVSLTPSNWSDYVPIAVGILGLLFVLAVLAIFVKGKKKVSVSKVSESDTPISLYKEVTPQAAQGSTVNVVTSNPSPELIGIKQMDFQMERASAKSRAMALCEKRNVSYEDVMSLTGLDDPQAVYQYLMGHPEL